MFTAEILALAEKIIRELSAEGLMRRSADALEQ